MSKDIATSKSLKKTPKDKKSKTCTSKEPVAAVVSAESVKAVEDIEKEARKARKEKKRAKKLKEKLDKQTVAVAEVDMAMDTAPVDDAAVAVIEAATPENPIEEASNDQAVALADIEEAQEEIVPRKNGKKKNGQNPHFQRIQEEQVEFLDERLKDNSFLSKGGAVGSWGEKAFNDLKVTKGKDFTKAKNKKKKGSYRGGLLDMQVHSIKFED